MAKNHCGHFRQGRRGQNHDQRQFATGLALRGHKTAVIDFMTWACAAWTSSGCERRVVYDLINVIQGEAAEPGADQTSSAATWRCWRRRKPDRTR
jgi:hypothetical protein